MKRLITILALGIAAPAMAQQPPAPDYTLTVSTADLATIGNALSDQPFKTVNPLLQKLNAQIQQQEIARQKPKDQEKAPGQGDASKPHADAPPQPAENKQ